MGLRSWPGEEVAQSIYGCQTGYAGEDESDSELQLACGTLALNNPNTVLACEVAIMQYWVVQ
jgi:hypothetical protein